MAEHDWNAHYASGELPWDTGEPTPHLTEWIRSGALRPGRALEVGCGTGTNALWLASQGFDVVGVDVSPLAIDMARAKAKGRPSCRFEVLDFLKADPPGGPYRVVFDRGCFHVFDEAEIRTRFAERVASLLEPGGMWLSIIGSTEGAPREMGPPRRSARDIAAAVEPALELVDLRAADMDPKEPSIRAWVAIARRREMPAQPSTKRD